MKHDERITEAIAAVLEADERPSVRNVRAWISDNYTAAPSMREIAPAVMAWRAKHHRGRPGQTVRRLATRYHALDAEQRQLFRDLTCTR